MQFEKTIKNKKQMIVAFIGLFLIVFIIGSFCDLEFAKAIYHPNQPFWMVITSFGLYLYCLCYVFFIGVLYGHADQIKERDLNTTKKFKTNCLIAFLIAGAAVSKVAIMEDCFGVFFDFEKVKYLAMAGVFLIFVLPIFILGMKVKISAYNLTIEKRLKDMLVYAIFAFLTVQLLKSFICRPRFRLVVKDENVAFRNWFACPIRFLSKEETPMLENYYSFPSGHSVSVITFVCFMPALAWVSDKLKNQEKQLTIIGLVLALLVVISRLVLGAHYLSDVSMGSMIGLTALFLFLNKQEKQLDIKEGGK